jgi:YDG domain/MBG domain (YGX type)
VAADKTYDGTANATTSGTLSGLIAGDAVMLASSGSFADKNAGTSKTVNVAANLSGADAANYALSSNTTTTATIGRAPLTITANDASAIANGRAYSGGNGVRYSGLVAGESASVLTGTLDYGGSAQGAIATGIYSIAPSGMSSGNYSLSYVDGTLSMVADPLTLPRQQAALQISGQPARQADRGVIADKEISKSARKATPAILVCDALDSQPLSKDARPLCIVGTGVAANSF